MKIPFVKMKWDQTPAVDLMENRISCDAMSVPSIPLPKDDADDSGNDGRSKEAKREKGFS